MVPDAQGLQEEISFESIARQVKIHKSLFFAVFLIAVHSILLGVFIFIFTERFYFFFFGVEIDNFFFVRQSGLFLLCLGLFYLIPLLDLNKYNLIVIVIIITKILAVGFLVIHTQHAPRPWVIILAAFVDGSMAACLSRLLIKFKRS